MENARTGDMVTDAIRTLKERGGSSLYNIKKYIEAVYKVDMRYRAPYIRKFIRTAVDDGELLQTRGRGASGSFKLPPRTPSKTKSEALTEQTPRDPRTPPPPPPPVHRPPYAHSVASSTSTASTVSSRAPSARTRAPSRTPAPRAAKKSSSSDLKPKKR